MTGLATEQAAIMACVRRGLGHHDVLASADNLDWDAFLTEVDEQGLAPLVHRGLGALDGPPADHIIATLRAERALTTLRHRAYYEPALRQTIGALHDLGLDPIVLKGAALTYLAYPAPGLRTMADIDLLLPLDQLHAANAALCAVGFRLAPNDLPDDHHHLPPLITPDRQLAVELHHHVLPEANPFAIDIDTVRARARVRRLGDVDALVLASEDALLHICVHLAWGHRYRWFPLRTLVDILTLTTDSQPAIDWHLFLAIVRQTRTAGAVYWPLYLSQTWLQAPVPDFVLDRLAPPALMRRLLQSVIESPYVLNGNAPRGAGTSVLYNLLRELSLYSGCSGREQAGAVWQSLFPPTDAVGHLPTDVTSSPLRYLLRLWYPLRLVRGLSASCKLVTQLITRPDCKGSSDRWMGAAGARTAGDQPPQCIAYSRPRSLE